MSNPPTSNQVYHMSLRWTIQNVKFFEGVTQPDDDSEWWECHQKDLDLWCKDMCATYIFQLEDTTDNLHFQGYINLKTKTRAKTLAKSLNDRFPGIEIRPSSTGGIYALKNYCMKDETRVAGPWADKEVYMGQDLPTELLPWQQKLKDYILGPVNPRELIWVYDEGGNSGKSAFCKYMSFHFKTLKLTYGNAGDLLNLVSKKAGRRGYLFDLTRTKPSQFSSTDLYSAMEDVKNGHFINTKYETDEILMIQPHIVVFANRLPESNAVSADRWTIVTIPDTDKPPASKRARFSFD